MPSYITLVNFTEQGIKTVKDLPKSVQGARQAIEKAGGKILDWNLTMGQYDAVVKEVPDDYTTIKEAIDNAASGDTIYVKKGVYHENLGIDKRVSLIGEDRNSTIIDGAPSEGYRVPVSIKCDGVNISGFTLRYGYAGIQIGEIK